MRRTRPFPWRRRRALALTLACCACCAVTLPASRLLAQTEVQDTAAGQVLTTAPVTARLTAAGQDKTVTLVARTDELLFFTESKTGVGQRMQLEVDRVEAATFESFSYPRFEVFRAITRNNWQGAIDILLPAVTPYLPYLDLPDNNAADSALEVGDYLMRDAERQFYAARTDEAEAQALSQYEAAYRVLRLARRATWYSGGTIAYLKSIRCLMALGKIKTAEDYFERVREPIPGDAAYGLYWLVKAEVEASHNRFPAAMDAAVKSLCFENKDADTFPDALLMSARCYEEMQEWHRARDVYFEVARIFPYTDWATAATNRLTFIMNEGKTEKEEKVTVKSVFFAWNEDLNGMVRDYLEKLGQEQEEEEEDYGTLDELKEEKLEEME